MIIGLQTETVTRPNTEDLDGPVTFKLRTALSPYECEQAAEQVGFRGINAIMAQTGKTGLRDVIDALSSGRSAEDIATELNDGETPPDAGEAEGEAKDETKLRAMYDLDWAAARLVRSWSYRDDKGRKVPVKLKYVRMLDATTRSWLHDKVWAAMRHHQPEDVREGNS